MSPCPAPEDLGAYAERRLPPSESEAMESHLADCTRCREAAVFLAPPPVPEIHGRRWWPAAAAALLVVSLGLAWPRREKALPAPSLRAPSGDRTLLVGHAVSVTLREGSRWEGLSLLSGSAWIEDPGEALEVRVPGGVLSFSKASLLVEVLAEAKASLLLRDAWAASPRLRIWVRDGSAELRHADGSVEKFLPSPAPGSWRGETGWRKGSPVSEPYVWESVLRRKDPSGSAAIRFPAGGRCWEIPLGTPLLEAKDLLRVRVESRSGRVRVRAGAYELLEAPVSSLEDRMKPVEGRPGLRILGGIEVLKERSR